MQVKVAAHNCVLVNRHFLKNFIVNISGLDFIYIIDNCCNIVIFEKF